MMCSNEPAIVKDGHTQATCLLQHGYSKRLMQTYIEVATDAHKSQLELANQPQSEAAGAKRQRLQQELADLRSSPKTGADRQHINQLQREYELVTRIIGVGKQGGKRDQVHEVVAVVAVVVVVVVVAVIAVVVVKQQSIP